jgi:ADP-ribose pyrophosphatase YjhB (NUDIX family)
MTETVKESVGVIVGDFQCAKLNDGYRELIDYVIKQNHHQIIIFLRIPGTCVSKKYPLSYMQRYHMIRESYPDNLIWFCEIHDEPSMKVWSKTLDKTIEECIDMIRTSYPNNLIWFCEEPSMKVCPKTDVIIYGLQSTPLFLIDDNVYCGKYKVDNFIPKNIKELNDLNDLIAFDDNNISVRHSPDVIDIFNESFRRGIMYASNQRFDTMYQAIDIVIFSCLSTIKKDCKIVVGKKKIYRDEYILPGGFVDPLKDKTLRDTCIREAFEETNLQISTPIYVDSFVTDDYRYRYENDKIMTHLHYAYAENIINLKAGDDLSGVEVIELTPENIEKIRPAYRKMVEMVLEKLKIK